MNEIVRFIGASLCFFMTLVCVIFYAAGMHGRLMFRPHMIEDWIIWGIATTSFLFGVFLIVRGVKKQTHNAGLPK
jgi:hypothetical protein